MGILVTPLWVYVGTPLLLDVSKKGASLHKATTISAPGPLSLALSLFFLLFLLPIAFDCSPRPFFACPAQRSLRGK